MSVETLITDNIDVWTSAIKTKSASGRGSSKKIELYGIKKLRELILELAVRGKLVPQDPADEPASMLLDRIAEEKAQLIKEKKIKKQKSLGKVNDNEALFELPKGWEWTRLSAVAEIGPRNNDIADELEVSFVPMPMISKSYKGEHDSEVRIWRDIKKGYTHFRDGDIALAKITPCFENSKAAVFSNLKNGIGTGTTELHIARPIVETLNPLFVLLYLKAPMFLKVGETKMTGSAGQKRVPKDFFAENPLPFAPLAEQHRIVTKVDELMSLCDQLEQQTETSIEAHQTLVEVLLNTLTSSADAEELMQNWQRISEHFDTLFTTEKSIDTLKQAILQLAVMGKLVPQDPNDEPASKLLERITAKKYQLIADKKIKKQEALPPITDEEKPFELPNGWEWCRGEVVADFIDPQPSHRTPAKVEGGIPYIGYTDIDHDEGIKFSSARKVSQNILCEHRERYTLRDGDFVFGKIGTLGQPFFLTKPFDYCLSANLILIQPKREYINAKFLALYLNSPVLYQVLGEQKTNSTHGVFGIKKARLLLIPLPPKYEQNSIVEKVKVLGIICNQLKAHLKESQLTQLHLTNVIVDLAVN